VYQLIVPIDVAAANDTVPGLHLLPAVVEVIVGIEFMVAITAVLGETQPPFDASAK